MDSRPRKKLYKSNLLSEIPYQQRRTLCMMLDSRDDWKHIVGHIKSYDGTEPRYNDLHVMMFEREKLSRYGSPTDCLLNDWRSIRPKISDLMDVLICARLKSVADFVNEQVLMEGKVNMPVQTSGEWYT